MFENKNPDDLAEKLEQLINSGSEREKLGKEARKRVVEKFDLEKITLNFVELYNTLAKDK